ncbi:hypothetical protein P152DRAFT_363778, partial [Eremomyces bilateralis CBS 781.70]
TALAQDPGPSPTESFGCAPHGDHWHCEGPAAPPTSAASVVSPGPSPTESVGCVPHDDHCVTVSSAESAIVFTSSSAVGAMPSSHGEDHASGTGAPHPSPTASYGCEPHGDHWHCDGARSTTGGMAPGTIRVSATRTSSSLATFTGA